MTRPTVRPARAFWLLALITILPSGCQAKRPSPRAAALRTIDYAAPLPEGQVALRKIGPAEYPDFAPALLGGDLAALKRSTEQSLTYLQRPGSRKAFPYLDITHDRAVATLRAFGQLLEQGPFRGTSQELNRLIAERFDVYQSVGAPRPDGAGFTGQVLFTGYFTPTYDASLTRGGPYQWPLYKRPGDLVTDASGEHAFRLSADGHLPYYTRQDIEAGGKLAGQELVWLTSRWNAYVVTVQGSGRLRLPDGQILEVGYAGTNGYPYTSPGSQMIKDGLIPRQGLSFEALRKYFETHPAAMDQYLWMNQRTTFFTVTHGGPFGALNVPVTAFATIATDKNVYPAALPALVNAPASYNGNNLAGRFMLDQDKGGAIRSAGRCDIYMGIGQSAEELSGHQFSPGQLYYLALKAQLVPR